MFTYITNFNVYIDDTVSKNFHLLWLKQRKYAPVRSTSINGVGVWYIVRNVRPSVFGQRELPWKRVKFFDGHGALQTQSLYGERVKDGQLILYIK